MTKYSFIDSLGYTHYGEFEYKPNPIMSEQFIIDHRMKNEMREAEEKIAYLKRFPEDTDLDPIRMKKRITRFLALIEI